MWLKNLRKRKSQTILMFLIISFCTTLLAGALNILTSLDKPSRDFAKECNAATAKVYPDLTAESEIHSLGDQFLTLKNVKKIEYVKDHYIDENVLINGKKEELYPHLTIYNKNVFGTDIYLEGDKSKTEAMADDECVVPACISNKYDVHIGDNITIQLAKKNITYRVVAVYTDPYQTSTAFDCNILINQFPSGLEDSSIIYIYGKDNITGDQINVPYLKKYNGILNGYFQSLEERIGNGLIVSRIIGALFLSVGIIMLFVSALMIYYMIKNAMHADVKSIAVYRTIGYTFRDILFMYLKVYFLIITMGCIIGIICSVFISNTILTATFQNMGRLHSVNSISSGIVCYLVIVSFVMFVITVIISKTKIIKPVQILNGSDYGGIKRKKSYKGNSSLQFSALGIAYRNFVREKRNALSILITCIVTIFSVNFIVISMDVANTMKEHNDFWVGIDRSDVIIDISDNDEYKAIESIVKKDKRTDYFVNCSLNNTVSMKWEKGMSRTLMSAVVYEDYKRAKLSVTEGRNPKADNEIAITTTMAKKLNKNIGDYITIYFKNRKSTSLLITGYFQCYKQFGEMCRLTPLTYEKNNAKLQYDTISVYLKNSKDTQKYISDIKKKLGNKCKVIKRTQQDSSIMEMISTPQQNAIPPVAILIVLMAGLNIFSIVFLRNIKAQKINGIYKCIGYTTWHLIFSNLCYVVIIALVSIGITYPASYYLYSPIIKLSLSMLNFKKYPMQFNAAHIIMADIAVLIIFIISTVASSKALFKVSARDLVQE